MPGERINFHRSDVDQTNQLFKNAEKITDEKILALSWNIATEPKLYRQLAPNPYSPKIIQIISERFPDKSDTDVIRAIVLAEPEGRYDRNLEYLETAQREEELRKQINISSEINKLLDEYCKKYAKDLRNLSKEAIYDKLFWIIFGTFDLEKIEQSYTQDQRRDFKLSIVSFIEDPKRVKDRSDFSRQLLKIGFVALSLALFFYIAQRQIQIITQHPQAKKQVLAAEIQEKNQALPVRLKIPSIQVDAVIQYVGLTSEGAMDVPSNTIDVGWFEPGPRPGEKGSAVIAGHFDGENNKEGVFTNLHKLKKGDKLYIEDDKGTSAVFVVAEKLIYDPAYSDGVFSRTDRPYLNLITCDGAWDGTKKSYSKRLVVFTTAESVD